MTVHTATAQAHPNIAFIKYWGNRDEKMRLPVNGSISMNLDGLFTRTTVSFQHSLALDELIINGKEVTGPGLVRMTSILDEVRHASSLHDRAEVSSENNFPIGAGIASSASAFAALALAATKAAGLDWSEAQLSRLARHGSGSACRSVPGGFVEWSSGATDEDSFAASIAPSDYWELVDCVAILSSAHKTTGSTEGHALAGTSPLQAGRIADAPRRLEICRRALLGKDFDALAEIIELDSNLMHAVMMTSTPPLIYWQPGTLELIHAVREWRRSGLSAAYTIDAGPNVHVICLETDKNKVEQKLHDMPDVHEVLTARVGGPARFI